MAVWDLYFLITIGNSEAAEETRPSLLYGGLPGTAIPHASCPRCCRARNESMTKGMTLCPSREKIPITPQFSCTNASTPRYSRLSVKLLKIYLLHDCNVFSRKSKFDCNCFKESLITCL